MRDVVREIAEEYATALEDHLLRGEESGLQRAYELGRSALKADVSLLEFVVVHHRILNRVLNECKSRGEADRRLEAATQFAAEALSPFEIVHRGLRDTSAALHRINQRFESETKRIAHALHDEAGPLLVSAHLTLKDVGRDLPAPAQKRLELVRAQLNEIEDQLRHLSHEIRPTILDDLDLLSALEFLAEGVMARSDLRVEIDAQIREVLPPGADLALYHVVREALSNIVRHARAGRARVELSSGGGHVHCVIRDDGIGMQASVGTPGGPRPGLGLVGIRERIDSLGGTLRIDPAPGRGTEITVSIPLGG